MQVKKSKPRGLRHRVISKLVSYKIHCYSTFLRDESNNTFRNILQNTVADILSKLSTLILCNGKLVRTHAE